MPPVNRPSVKAYGFVETKALFVVREVRRAVEA
jgi:hypothetical protein